MPMFLALVLWDKRFAAVKLDGQVPMAIAIIIVRRYSIRARGCGLCIRHLRLKGAAILLLPSSSDHFPRRSPPFPDWPLIYNKKGGDLKNLKIDVPFTRRARPTRVHMHT